MLLIKSFMRLDSKYFTTWLNGPKLQWLQWFVSTRTERAPQDCFSFTRRPHCRKPHFCLFCPHRRKAIQSEADCSCCRSQFSSSLTITIITPEFQQESATKVDTEQLWRDAFGSTHHRKQAFHCPGLCKTPYDTLLLSKIQFWIALNIYFKIICSLQGFSLHPRQGIIHIHEPFGLNTSRLSYFDLLCLNWNINIL